MPPVATTQDRGTRYMQGVAVPAESVNRDEFFRRTRRHTTPEVAGKAFAGLGLSDLLTIRKADILAEITIRFSGTLTTLGTATRTTSQWPYNLLRLCRFTANGQSNIISCDGLTLKARDLLKKADLSDRGVTNTMGGVSRTQGTFAQASENWGVGSSSTTLSAGDYPVELQWTVPVAEDTFDLAGAIYAASSATDLTLNLDWESVGNLFYGYNAATEVPVLVGTLQVISTKFSIPLGANGEIVIPDLSVFHSLIQARTTEIANGPNEPRLIGQGAGKALLRVMFQVKSGAGTAQAPLAMTKTNFSRLSWRYAGNETPDEYVDGRHLRMVNERAYNVDLGVAWGFGVHEFASENAFRDTVDMGTTSELRLVVEIPAAVSLTSPVLDYSQEVIFNAGQGA